MTIKWSEPSLPSRKWNRMRPLKNKLLLAFLAAVVLPVTGCQSMYTGLGIGNYWNESKLRHRNSAAAKYAWNSRFNSYLNQPNIRDFARGFKAGYVDVADGGTGCVPIFPPREYWGWKYQSCEGQGRVAAWFAGYPHGARAAEEDGIGNYYQMQTSANVQHQYAEHGRLDPQFQGIYPVPPNAIPNRFLDASGASPIGRFPSPEDASTELIMTFTDIEND